MNEKNLDNISDFDLGEYNKDYEKYFSGKSYLSLLNDKELPIYNVTFEAGCRNNWHIHKGNGQILVCVGGSGWYQEFDKEPRRLKAGDVVYIAPDIKHWHGAVASEWFSHLAITVPSGNNGNEWCEEVSDEYYSKLPN